MNLYCWKPRGHGEVSIFVTANSLEEALAIVNERITDEKERYNKWLNLAEPDDEYPEYPEYSFNGWGTDYYTLHVLGPGEVIFNEND